MYSFLSGILFSFCISSGIYAQPCDTPVLSQANNRFAFDMYHSMMNDGSEVFFSPYSIYSALQMTGEGARGITAKEMQHVLYNNMPECIRKDIGNTQVQFNKLLDAGDSIHTANSLWLSNQLEINSSYENLVKDHYRAVLNKTDFLKDPEGSRKTINTWVEKHTNNRIRNLLVERTIIPRTKLVLVNAIWFKGKWAIPFKKESTRNDMFYSKEGDVSVPFMNEDMVVNYAEDNVAQVIELPYKSNKLSMIIALPVPGKEAEFEKQLGQDKLKSWVAHMNRQHTLVSLPKFKMETNFELVPALRRSGMRSAFSDSADFSGISQKTALTISNVIHKAFIEVDEEGTEAAAATAVVMNEITSIHVKQRPVKLFKADRPFVFMLCDSETKMILFMGKMEKPGS